MTTRRYPPNKAELDLAASLRAQGLRVQHDPTSHQGDFFVARPGGQRQHVEFRHVNTRNGGQISKAIADKNSKMALQRARGTSTANVLAIDGTPGGHSANTMTKAMRDYLADPRRAADPNSLKGAYTRGRVLGGQPRIDYWSGQMLRHPKAVGTVGKVALPGGSTGTAVVRPGRAKPAMVAVTPTGNVKPVKPVPIQPTTNKTAATVPPREPTKRPIAKAVPRQIPTPSRRTNVAGAAQPVKRPVATPVARPTPPSARRPAVAPTTRAVPVGRPTTPPAPRPPVSQRPVASPRPVVAPRPVPPRPVPPPRPMTPPRIQPPPVGGPGGRPR